MSRTTDFQGGDPFGAEGRAMARAAKVRASAAARRMTEPLAEDTYAAHLKPAPLAPWLADPSLLPKAPPGRVGQ